MSRPDLNQVKENIEYIAIGSELLTSSYPETNSLFLADKLENLGLEIKYKSVVSDRLDDIVGAVKVALSRSRLILSAADWDQLTMTGRGKQWLAW